MSQAEQEKIDYLAVMDGDTVIFENRILGNNRNYPAGGDKCVNGCHHGRSG